MFGVATKGFDEPLFLDLQRAIVDLPRSLEEKALEATVELEAELKQIYRTAPPRSSKKFVWSLDPAADARARGWWFWQVGLGNIPTDGQHYKRQGDSPYGVVAEIEQAQHAVTIQVVMKDPKMRFPFGQLKEPNTQLPGHKDTGWQWAYPLVTEAMRRATNTVVDGIFQELSNI